MDRREAERAHSDLQMAAAAAEEGAAAAGAPVICLLQAVAVVLLQAPLAECVPTPSDLAAHLGRLRLLG